MSETAVLDSASEAVARGKERVAHEAEEYAGDAEPPLRGFIGIMAAYAGAVAVGAVVVRRRGRRLPERISLVDIAVMSVATHKLSRLLTRGSVTSVIRAPFTRFAGSSGPAELREEVRGTGARKAVGELVTCPFCVGVWVMTAFGFGLVLAPRATRLAGAVLTAVTGADMLQFAHAALEKRSTPPAS